jgi:hypothetical protein
VPDQFGTSDAVILDDDTITIVDLKTGMGVKVDAYKTVWKTVDNVSTETVVVNPQLALYALGALGQFEMLGNFTHVRMVISQPRLGHVSEHTITVEELLAFADEARDAAALAMTDDAPLNPSEDACRFCKAKAVCPALVQEVFDTTAADASDFDTKPYASQLSIHMSKVGMIEDWCKAIRAEVERELFAGNDVPGYKLVEGRAGNRKWVDESAVKDKLKSYRLKIKEMYDMSLISPTTAEKILTPARWAKLKGFVKRSAGKPSVAPVTDEQPVYNVAATAEDFG